MTATGRPGLLSRLIEPRQQIPEERKRFSNADLRALIIPIILEQFLVLLVGIADTLMITYAGESAVSAVSLVNQLNNVFIMVFTALASGGAVIASQYLGSEDPENGSLAAGQLVMLTTVVSLIMTAVVLLFGRQIFGLLFGKVEPSVLDDGLIYLRISAYSFPFIAVSNGYAAVFRTIGKTGTLLNVSILMNLINVAGNAIGIFILHAGVAGVAYPSLLSRVVGAGLLFWLGKNPQNALQVRSQQLFTWKSSMIRRIFRIAIPNSVESGLFQLAKVALSSIVALFGTTQIAANGMAQSFWSMAALFCIAMGPVFITVIGQYMGAGDMEGAEYYSKKLLRLTYVGAVTWNLLFFLIVPLILRLSSLSDQAIRLVILLSALHNVFNALLCPTAFALSNGLRAAGDARFTMCAAVFSSVGIRVSLSVLFGIVWNLGVIGITLAMICDWAVKAALIAWRYRSGKWKRFTVI